VACEEFNDEPSGCSDHWSAFDSPAWPLEMARMKTHYICFFRLFLRLFSCSEFCKALVRASRGFHRRFHAQSASAACEVENFVARIGVWNSMLLNGATSIFLDSPSLFYLPWGISPFPRQWQITYYFLMCGCDSCCGVALFRRPLLCEVRRRSRRVLDLGPSPAWLGLSPIGPHLIWCKES